MGAAAAGRRLTASAQISVTSSISVGSPIAQEIVTSTLGNLTADSMNMYLGSSFAVTDVAAPTTASVSGATGTINAPAGGTAKPAASPSSGSSSTNMAPLIGAVAAGCAALGLLAVVAFFRLAKSRPSAAADSIARARVVNTHPTVVTEKPMA